ncbi:siderophore ABC transporter substrate-binding protein [Actinomyces urogenitalis]|uniref:siderophore ABC transporter substrate-binding protein n=1 Tax=Actinomyces urogenitalis TaxID=103621 RepID=UPI00242E8B22|nr:ABC transporter substrate-binding protein [Actinomyces urogenitalis]MCI7457315.1 ABC transporter substrate-binding protein [Actinomyces urogenitalis]
MSHKSSALLALAAACLDLTACGSGSATSTSTSPTATSSTTQDQASGTVTIETNNGSVEVTRPVQRVAALDNRSFEVLASWDVPLVAAPKTLIPSTVTAYDGDEVTDIGNHREPDLEALVAAEPDLIISGQRFSQYDEQIATLTEGTPLLDLEPREDQPLDSELIRHVTALGEVFGKESEATQLVDDFKAALARAKEAYDGSSTVMAVNVSGGEIGYVAPGKGRTFGPLFDLLGLTPALEVDGATTSHTGDDISVEAIAQSNPDWILVLDRDGAIAADEEGYTPAQDVISGNAALQNVTVLCKGQVVYAPADTYTNESIITYTEILNAVADAFEAAGKQA